MPGPIAWHEAADAQAAPISSGEAVRVISGASAGLAGRFEDVGPGGRRARVLLTILEHEAPVDVDLEHLEPVELARRVGSAAWAWRLFPGSRQPEQAGRREPSPSLSRASDLIL